MTDVADGCSPPHGPAKHAYACMQRDWEEGWVVGESTRRQSVGFAPPPLEAFLLSLRNEIRSLKRGGRGCGGDQYKMLKVPCLQRPSSEPVERDFPLSFRKKNCFFLQWNVHRHLGWQMVESSQSSRWACLAIVLGENAKKASIIRCVSLVDVRNETSLVLLVL